MRRLLFDTQEAVSESIGYILISGILLISFVLLFSVGYPVYSNQVDSQHMRNIEGSMAVIAYNGNTVALLNSPTSTSELIMYGGNLQTRTSGTIKITLYQDTVGTPLIKQPAASDLNMLEYSKGTEKVAYIAGSVCKGGPWGSVLLRTPEFYETDDTVVLPIVDLADSSVAVGGDGPVRITFLTPYYSKLSQTVTSPVAEKYSPVRQIKIDITGDYRGALKNYLVSEFGYTPVAAAAGTESVQKTFPGPMTVYVLDYQLTVEGK